MGLRTANNTAYWTFAYSRNSDAFVKDFQRVMQRVLHVGATSDLSPSWLLSLQCCLNKREPGVEVEGPALLCSCSGVDSGTVKICTHALLAFIITL